MSNHNDFTPQPMSSGAPTTGFEIHKAGGNQFNHPTVNERLVQIQRDQDALDAWVPLSDEEPHVPVIVEPFSWREKVNIIKGTLGVIALIGIVLGCSLYYQGKKFSFRDEIGVFFSDTYPVPSAQLESSRRSDWNQYKSLFVDTARMDNFYAGCAVKSCWRADFPAFQKYSAFAKSPQTYESDICATKIKLSEGFSFAHSLNASWKIRPQRENGTTHVCYLGNKPEVQQALDSHNGSKRNMAIGLALIPLSLLIFLLLRYPKKPQAKASQPATRPTS